MEMTHVHRGLIAFAFTIFLAACETAPIAPPELGIQAQVRRLDIAKAMEATANKELELKQVLEIYWDGRYEEAIVKLTPLATAAELPLSSQIKAVKFMAFSNCVSGRLPACKKNFAGALLHDPSFRLDAAEKGHPVWGRQFELALADSQKRIEVMTQQEAAMTSAETKTDTTVATEKNSNAKPKRPAKQSAHPAKQ